MPENMSQARSHCLLLLQALITALELITSPSNRPCRISVGLRWETHDVAFPAALPPPGKARVCVSGRAEPLADPRPAVVERQGGAPPQGRSRKQ